MLEPDMVNTIVFEERKQQKEERELKNHILNIKNEDRKRELWQHYFPTVQSDDNWLKDAVIF